MHKHKNFIRVLCSLLTLIFICFAFAGCKARALTPTSSAIEVVGKVGEYDVPYEELYMLATLYNNDSISSEALWEKISQNITANYATLALCEQVGVEYDEKQLEDDVKLEVESYIENNFDGSRSDYLDSLKANGMTDHYLRTVIRTDLLYNSRLIPTLAAKGQILTAQDDIVAYARENFALTLHIMIANNEGDNPEENLAAARAALADLQSGRTSMYKLIGGKLNEDVMLVPDGGYLVARGTGNADYEAAAFALGVGESTIVSTTATLASGEAVDCHYVIQRLELNEEYVETHYTDIYDEYQNSVADSMREQVRATLSFAPNDYAKSLDIKNLKAPSAGIDLTLIIVISVIAVLVIGLTVVIIIIVRKRRAKFLRDKQNRALTKNNGKN